LARTGLDAEEREEIRVGLDRGDSLAEVARRLRRPTSAVSREVKRNGGRGRYAAVQAGRRAARKRARSKSTVFQADPALASRVADQLAEKDSPMTIAIAEGISHETIYQGIYAGGRRGLPAGLGRHLHRHRRHRKARPRGGAPSKKASPLGLYKGIALRPEGADEREEVGHLEGDLIIGQAGASAVVTLIDRATSFAMLGSLEGGHTAEQVANRVEMLLRRFPPEARRTLTWDQGREMARWPELEELSGVSVYFAGPSGFSVGEVVARVFDSEGRRLVVGAARSANGIACRTAWRRSMSMVRATEHPAHAAVKAEPYGWPPASLDRGSPR